MADDSAYVTIVVLDVAANFIVHGVELGAEDHERITWTLDTLWRGTRRVKRVAGVERKGGDYRRLKVRLWRGRSSKSGASMPMSREPAVPLLLPFMTGSGALVGMYERTVQPS